MQESRSLIVICSPKSAKSKWVNEEIRYFKSLGREHRVLCLIVDGEPYAGWDDAELVMGALAPFQPQKGKALSFFEEMFHPPVPSLKPIDSCGAFWAINMLADSHRNPAPAAASHKEEIHAKLLEVQEVLELYRMENGGWRMFPGAQQSAPPNSYSTVLALLALLECKKAELPWLGSVERRDAMLQASAVWLHKQFHQGAKAAGWRGTGENRYEVFDGLTLQVYATLLRAHNEAGIAMPLPIMKAMEHHLIQCAFRPATFPVASGEFESELMIHGNNVQRKEAYRFLWYPWALNAIEQWLIWEKSVPQPTETLVRIRRTRAHLIREIGDDVVNTAEGNWLFIAAETLYGLSPAVAERK